ncbi:transport integral membrane protein [Streptomyces viridosporus ATCC 14672]|uniref:Transport integral membrane protein n=2 Tax=Streptomyces viridosporus TaxID=67581 RepID=D6A681_STRV1|nr:MIP/aquaporin family protein [Streptomyces viridosporus]EFE67852.1 transport integral membrane protein [Streptomyces viridosporus ATCC 14672]
MAQSAVRRRGYREGLGGEMIAEFLGTFVLLLLGVGSVAVAVVGLPGSGRQVVEFGPANWLIIGWGWGLAVVFGVYVAGGVSGAHINPAVTLAFAVRRDFPWRKVLPYWLAQLAGAFVGAALVYACYRWAIDAANAQAGVPRDQSLATYSIFATFPAEYFGNSWWGPLLDQIVGTGILLLLICALIDTRNTAPMSNLGPFLIGLVVVAIGFTFGTNAGYAINPARDFGPRLFTFFEGWGSIALPGTFGWFSGYWWIPIVGPLIGAVAGVLVYDLLITPVLKARRKEAEEAEEGPATQEP